MKDVYVYAPQSLSAPPPRAFNHKDASIPRPTYLENGHIVLSNGVGGFSNWLI